MHKKITTLFCFIYFFTSTYSFAQDEIASTKENIEKHIKALSAIETAGRMPGTPGIEIAKTYIINEFKNAKINPFAPNEYAGEFEVVTKNKSNRANSQIILNDTKELKSFKSACYYQPLFSSENAPLTDKEVVFAGYGIINKEKNYDDYADIDVKGKIVLLLRYDATESSAEKFAAPIEASFKSKFTLAKEKGACGVIIFNGFNSKQSGEKDTIQTQYYSFSLKSDETKIPCIQVKQSLIKEMETISQINFSEIQKNIDENKKPNSFLIPNLKLSLDIQFEKAIIKTSNIVALIPGNDPILKEQFIVVGAHYDHIGLGTFGSRTYTNDSNLIHPGADDNASGTSCVIEIGKYLKKCKLKRSVILICFSSEEMGLFGSISFLKQNEKIIKSIKAMINFDMVGNYREEIGIRVNGVDTSLLFKSIFESVETNKLKFYYTKYSPEHAMSDNCSFFQKGIPSMHYFTGFHERYHKPTDTSDTINFEGAAKIALQAGCFVEKLSNTSEEIVLDLQYKPKGLAAPGINLIRDPNNLKILSIVENSPAAKAGLKVEDVILQMDHVNMESPMDYFNMLRDYNVDSKLILLIRRKVDNEEKNLEVTIDL